MVGATASGCSVAVWHTLSAALLHQYSTIITVSLKALICPRHSLSCRVTLPLLPLLKPPARRINPWCKRSPSPPLLSSTPLQHVAAPGRSMLQPLAALQLRAFLPAACCFFKDYPLLLLTGAAVHLLSAAVCCCCSPVPPPPAGAACCQWCVASSGH